MENDLILKARRTPYACWSDIDSLISQAKNESTRTELREIRRSKELKEEYSSYNI